MTGNVDVFAIRIHGYVISTCTLTGLPESFLVKISALLVLSLIVISGVSIFLAPPVASANSPPRSLGFWLVDSSLQNCTWEGGYQLCGSSHPAQLFFNSMFLTPPYPSSAEILLLGIQSDHEAHIRPTSPGSFTQRNIAFFANLASLADSHPNIKLIFEVAFIPGNPTYGYSALQLYLNAFKSHPSVYAIGIDYEQTKLILGRDMTMGEVRTTMNYVTSTGKEFISYYIPTSILPSGALQIFHTNFPSSTDPESDLLLTGPTIVGISSGYYSTNPFPGSASCPIPLIDSHLNWNKCLVSTELSKAASLPSFTRQFLEFSTGFSSSGSFKGVSTLYTNQLWDNPTLRNWIWTDPNYASFVTSIGQAPHA
jgi:hypothetical protein